MRGPEHLGLPPLLVVPVVGRQVQPAAAGSGPAAGDAQLSVVHVLDRAGDLPQCHVVLVVGEIAPLVLQPDQMAGGVELLDPRGGESRAILRGSNGRQRGHALLHLERAAVPLVGETRLDGSRAVGLAIAGLSSQRIDGHFEAVVQALLELEELEERDELEELEDREDSRNSRNWTAAGGGHRRDDRRAVLGVLVLPQGDRRAVPPWADLVVLLQALDCAAPGAGRRAAVVVVHVHQAHRVLAALGFVGGGDQIRGWADRVILQRRGRGVQRDVAVTVVLPPLQHALGRAGAL